MAVVVAVVLACVEDEQMLHAKGVLWLIQKGNLGRLETDVRNCQRRQTVPLCVKPKKEASKLNYLTT